MFENRRVAPDDVAELERVEGLVRARYALDDGSLVLVSGDDARIPGAPPALTRILFWPTRGDRHRITVFKPPATVADDDLPPGWLRSALRDDTDYDCC